jgi:hypothetical protein
VVGGCRSDGPQPHLITIQFHRKMVFSVRGRQGKKGQRMPVDGAERCGCGCGWQHLSLRAIYSQDESYTPNRISVRVGSSLHTLKASHRRCVADVWPMCGWGVAVVWSRLAVGGVGGNGFDEACPGTGSASGRAGAD